MEETRLLSIAEAQTLLQQMVGQPLQWAIKSPDVELFDLGFGDAGEKLPPFVIHAICPVKVISHNGRKVRLYQGDTPMEKFRIETAGLLGLPVRRIALSDKHDLWLDLGEHWIVFITFEDGEESWRFFQSRVDQPHLVATDTCLEW